MKIFISWSGHRSRVIAETLNDWLRRVIQAVRPFYSPEIEKGAKWSDEVDAALEGTSFGIICLTPDNLNSTWIHYEAGALSKTKDALIWTFLYGLTPGDVPPPLGKFQHTVAERGDVLRLLRTINARLDEVGGQPLPERLLEENFELFWPRLEEGLRAAEQVASTSETKKDEGIGEPLRGERDILNEILEIVRSQQRRLVELDEGTIPKSTNPTPGIKRYSQIEIQIPPEEKDIDIKASDLQDILLRHILGATTEYVEREGTFWVRANINPPVPFSDITSVLYQIAEEAGFKLGRWIARPKMKA